MASCKHLGSCASLPSTMVLKRATSTRTATRCASGFSKQIPKGASSDLLAILQPHVTDAGKPLLAILQASMLHEQESKEKEVQILLRLLDSKENEKEWLLQLLHSEQNETEWLTESWNRTRVELLKARGLNNTRGLFEWFQEYLATQAIVTSQLKGVALWETILQANADLGRCLEACTSVPRAHTSKQAMFLYNVYSVLSQHIHSGKDLAALQVGKGGTIMFDRGPLTTEQVQVLLCMGLAAKVQLQEGRVTVLDI